MPTIDRFLVCGLGSLGQYCVYNLKKFALPGFEVYVTAIDRTFPQDLEVNDLAELLAEPVVLGDCCVDQVLLRAGVKECRAILLVTSNESVNIEAAIAARRLNPNIRLVVRSDKQNLNQLLKQQLGNFAAFEATDLPAPAFALAGLKAGILGAFNIGDYRLQVVQQTVLPRDYQFDGFEAIAVHKKNQYRLISHLPASSPDDIDLPQATASNNAFYQWRADTRIKPGDTVTFVELVGNSSKLDESQTNTPQQTFEQFWLDVRSLFQQTLQSRLRNFWRWIQANQTRRVAALAGCVAIFLWFLGVWMLNTQAQMPLQKSIFAAFILLLGGYGDLFGDLQNAQVPMWVNTVSLVITLTSLLFVLTALGLIADSVLSSRFDFLRKRPPVPRKNHVVLVGLGRVGQRVAALLKEFKQPVVAITDSVENAALAQGIPIVMGNSIQKLDQVNLATAKSLVVVTEDQMLNLEVALMARDVAQKADHSLELVVRTYDQRFSSNLEGLIPDARIITAYALSGAAFAGAAYGENILALFRLNDQTVLVTEYHIEQGDTLVDRLMSQVAYGYGVVPVFHQRRRAQPIFGEATEELMPSDERILQAGDRLIVLSTINGLRRIERGEIAPPRRWRLEAEKPRNDSFLLAAGNDLHRIGGCRLEVARSFMKRLPGSIELELYDYQARQIHEKLRRDLPMKLIPLN